MGCVNTKSQPEAVNSTPKKSSPKRRLSQCQTQSPLDSAHKVAPDQQSLPLNSPSRDLSSELLLKSPKALKPISLAPKNSKLLPTLKLPSNNPSLQDFSFKGSPEVSFEKDRTPVSLRSPANKDNIRHDNNPPSIARTSTPSFAKPAGLRIIASPGHNFPEIHIKDVNLWSLIPPKESRRQISPEIKEARSEDRSSSIDKDEKDRREELELSTGTEKREIVLPQREADKIKEELKGKLPTIIQTKPNRKFQHILLSDNGDGLGESPPQSKGNTPLAGQGMPLIIQSPPKTLSMLDPPYVADTKKSLELPDHTILSSPSNVNSVGTISNLVNLCKDVKKKDFEKKFRTNLVSLIKDKVPDEILDSRRPETDSQGMLSAKSVQNGRGLSNNRKLTSKILSPKSAFSQNLLNFATKEDENKSQRAVSENNYENVFGDIEGPSPISSQTEKQPSKNFMLPLQWLSTLSSPQKLTDTSMVLQDKSVYNFDEGLSKMDWERYSIQEQFNHVEIDDRSINQTHLEASIALENPNHSHLNISINGTEILENKPDELNMAKSRSVPHAAVGKSDEIIDLAQTKSNPPHPIERRHNNLMNESVSTLQYLSPKVVSASNISSRNPVRRMSRFTRNDSQVIETNRVDVSVDDGGQKKINQYILIKEIGRGGFGKVKLALNAETKKQHAIKIANKKKLKRKLLTRQKSAFTQLASEIAILKKMDHPNIVTLYEVIDDPNNDKLYLIMDYIKRGAIMSRNYWRQASKSKNVADDDGDDSPLVKKKMVLSEQKARKYFRHLILGLDYLHNYAEIIHRDIKPENLLVGEDDVLRISDFGISKIMEEGDDKLENNAGTQYYQPPEAWEGKSFHGKPTDIWAAGGTLYYFLVGKPPFQGMDLQRKIREEEPQFPEDLNINPKAVELIRGCLKKNAHERLSIQEIMKDPWLTQDGTDPLENEEYEKLVVNDDDCSTALTRVKFMAAVRVMAKLKKTLIVSRRNIAKRKNSEILSDNLQSPDPQVKNSGFNLIVVGE